MESDDTNEGHWRATPPLSSDLAIINADVPGTVALSDFYGSKNPPPLPSRPECLSPSHTNISKPSVPPPDYHASDNSLFGKPQLIKEALIDDPDADHWSDASVHEQCNCLGTDVLPPYLADILHNPEHSLFSLSVIQPDIRLDVRSGSTSRDEQDEGGLFEPPSSDDIANAVPHPNAYYWPKHNGWILLIWKSSPMLPPLAKSFVPDPCNPFPDLMHRKQTSSCIGAVEQPFGQVNKPHHFHYYQKAVDLQKLDPALRRVRWEINDQKKERRRKITSLDLDTFSIDQISTDDLDKEMDEGEGDLLNLYVCCQCSVCYIISNVIPGVIPIRFMDEFTRERGDNPPPNRNRGESVVAGLETFLM
jgi:ubiquitin carboxyl-terminal hydrolase 25